jgi:integrase
MARQKLNPYTHTDGQTWDGYFVDAKSGIIYYEARHAGKRIKFSTKETNGVKAKRVANSELEKRLGRKKQYVRALIKEELALYLKVKDSENRSYFTIKSYQRGARDIELFWGYKLPSEINRDTLTEWYAWWREHKPDVEIENAVKWMRNFCNYLSQKVVNGYPVLPAVPTIVDPNRKQILISRAKKKEKIISPSEFTKIYRTAEDSVHSLVVLFMYTMATRIDETLNLDFVQTIQLDDPIPKYRWSAGQNKSDLVGQHALHQALIEPLKALREIRKAEGTAMLFPQKINNQKGLREQQIDWNGWRKRADLGWHWTPHTFRHTCLTNVLNDSRVPQLVACKQYRVSPQVALGTYMKTKDETMLSLRDVIEVRL